MKVCIELEELSKSNWLQALHDFLITSIRGMSNQGQENVSFQKKKQKVIDGKENSKII